MPSWGELVDQFGQIQPAERTAWLNDRLTNYLCEVSSRRSDRNVILYASAFLQKPTTGGPFVSLNHEDLNGFMSVVYGMDCSRGLTLVLHTPGGLPNAAKTLVEYLWSKFGEFEVIVPTYAMSAGTMMALAATGVVMGKQSQLGPIDPQMPVGGRFVSAQAIVDQFEKAAEEIKNDTTAAHYWAPILQSMGPALYVEALNALDYGQELVAKWLRANMCKSDPDVQRSRSIAAFFNDGARHKNHGHGIGRDEAREQGVQIESLEDDQALQDAVLSAYHLATITFEQGPAMKMMVSSDGRRWVKNMVANQPPTVR